MVAPEEIVDPNVDEHSVMTSLSRFLKAKLKPKMLHPKMAKAYGPGEANIMAVHFVDLNHGNFST